MSEPIEKKSRRNFLTNALIGWIGLTFLPALYGIAKYLIPPTLYEQVSQSVVVGKINEIPSLNDGAKIVKYNKKAVVLFRTETNQVHALSAVCTHLGCIVQYQPNEKQFKCNCHGSIFDISGKNIAGPAPRPLSPYRVELKDDSVIVSQI